MLTFSFRPEESVIIDGNIRIKFLGFSGSQVRIGIDAPKSIPVRRLELAGSVTPPKNTDSLI